RPPLFVSDGEVEHYLLDSGPYGHLRFMFRLLSVGAAGRKCRCKHKGGHRTKKDPHAVILSLNKDIRLRYYNPVVGHTIPAAVTAAARCTGNMRPALARGVQNRRGGSL